MPQEEQIRKVLTVKMMANGDVIEESLEQQEEDEKLNFIADLMCDDMFYNQNLKTMAKIKVSTVKMTADCEVINVSARLISKSIKSKLLLEQMFKDSRREVQYYDKNRNLVNKLDEFGKQVYTYDHTLCEEQIDQVLNEVLPFLQELCDAFEE